MEKWVAALRSGKYQQGRNMLRPNDNQFCCLGVLCDISGLGKWEDERGDDITFYTVGEDTSETVLPATVRRWAGMRHYEGEFTEKDQLGVPVIQKLSGLNDSGRWSFEDIADIIEKNWEKL